MIRRSLNRLSDADGLFLENLLRPQDSNANVFPINDDKFQKFVSARIRRADKVVAVTVPENDDNGLNDEEPQSDEPIRKSSHIQALLAKAGEKMGFKIWLPKADRNAVLHEWNPESESLIDVLPLNYDDTTLRTIEQIDVLWLKGRAIMRAFEVEHTTAVYSGILRMADLLALQPNIGHQIAHRRARESQAKSIRGNLAAGVQPLGACSFVRELHVFVVRRD